MDKQKQPETRKITWPSIKANNLEIIAGISDNGLKTVSVKKDQQVPNRTFAYLVYDYSSLVKVNSMYYPTLIIFTK